MSKLEMYVPRMNETCIDRFVRSIFYRYAFQRRDKLFLASQYLLNRPFQICRPHLYVTAKHTTSMKLIVCSCIFFSVYITVRSVFIHELYSVLVIRVLWHFPVTLLWISLFGSSKWFYLLFFFHIFLSYIITIYLRVIINRNHYNKKIFVVKI